MVKLPLEQKFCSKFSQIELRLPSQLNFNEYTVGGMDTGEMGRGGQLLEYAEAKNNMAQDRVMQCASPVYNKCRVSRRQTLFQAIPTVSQFSPTPFI